MKVLITGGYGFIGSAVAERFHKEGHRIYILDNLSSGRADHLSIPHTFYRMNVEDPQCDTLFESVGFDIVVHLAAQISVAASLAHPEIDTRSNVLGLVNMLNSAAKHNVRKFIFASSAAVYGDSEQIPLREDAPCSPTSVYGINKLLGETYCRKWSELYKLDTLVLRFSNVYGPRQGNGGEGGVVSIFLNRVKDGKTLDVFGDGLQTRDFIYVHDVADAIYRGAVGDATGVYNLSTGTQTSVNELIETIGLFAPLPQTRYLPARVGDIAHSCLDNAKIKRDLDWVPLYSIGEGLAKTYEWLIGREAAATREEKPKRKRPAWLKAVLPYAENALGLAAIWGLSQADSVVFRQGVVDYRLLYILLMGLMHGSRQSLLASIAAIALHVADHLHNGRDWGSLLYDPESLFVSAIYLFFGLSVGFVKDKHARDRAFSAHELEEEKKRYRFLEGLYTDTKQIKEELQRQVLTSKDSLARLHAIVTELESQEPEQVVLSSVSVLEELIGSRKISVYSAGKSGYLRLLAQSSVENFMPHRSIRLSEAPKLQQVVDTKRLWANKELLPDMPLLVAPIVHDGEVAALVCVHELAFERFTLYHENVFRVAIELISHSLSRSFTFVSLTRRQRYVEGTEVLREAAFTEVLRGKQLAKEKQQADYVVVKLGPVNMALTHLSRTLSGMLRDTDYIGMIDGRLALLLSNTSEQEALTVIERLERHGLQAGLTKGEALYV